MSLSELANERGPRALCLETILFVRRRCWLTLAVALVRKVRISTRPQGTPHRGEGWIRYSKTFSMPSAAL